MNVVVDTNVLISSFFGGWPGRVMSAWREGRFHLCLSQPIVDEYVAVLDRMDLSSEPETSEILSLFARGWNTRFTARTPRLSIVASDPADDRFIECAVALKADFIVTGDRALLAVERYFRISVVTPRCFVEKHLPGPAAARPGA